MREIKSCYWCGKKDFKRGRKKSEITRLNCSKRCSRNYFHLRKRIIKDLKKKYHLKLKIQSNEEKSK